MLINFFGEILRSSGHRAKLLKMLQWILCPPIMGGGCRLGKSFLQLKISIGRGGRRWVINAWSTMSEHCKQMLYNFFRNVRRLKEHIFKKFLNFNILSYSTLYWTYSGIIWFCGLNFWQVYCSNQRVINPVEHLSQTRQHLPRAV